MAMQNKDKKIISRKLKVGVYMGGKTLESEVSFNSGRTVCDHLDVSKYEILPIFHAKNGSLYILPWRFLHRGKISDFEHRLDQEAQKIVWDDLKFLVDFIYIASHGHYVEDGTLQAMLEVLQIPYLGSKVLASALAMDKIIQKEILKSNGILVPNGFTVLPEELEIDKDNLPQIIAKLEQYKISFPIIIKPFKEGSSLGITVVKEESEIIQALIKAISINKNCNQKAIIEEFIEGMEFSCVIITDYKNQKLIPLIPTEIVLEQNSDFFDYEQKYMPGRAIKYTPARCNDKVIKKIQDVCLKVMNILEMENLARIDGFVTKGTHGAEEQIIITDPNTLSGMAPSSFIFTQAAENNMGHTELINHLIETDLHKYYTSSQEIIVNNTHLHDDSEFQDKFEINKVQTQKRDIINSDLYTQKDTSCRINVVVLLGGRSAEKEISLESGRNVVYKLSPQKYQAIPIFLDSNLNLYQIDNKLLVRNNTTEIAEGLNFHMKINWSDLPNIADFVFIALHGGEGENGCIQGTLETLGLPYNGSSVLTSAICMNKYKTNELLKIYGFDVPKNKLISKKDFEDNQDNIISAIEKTIDYPMIVKPHDDGCSILVNKANNQNDLNKYVHEIFKSGKKFALIEECILGTELTVGVIGNESVLALPPSETIASNNILSIEEKFLPGQGENQTPARLSQSALEFIKQTAQKAFKALNCKGYARIDCFYQEPNQSSTGSEKLIILEFNTLPALTPATCIFAQAAEIGLKPMEFIDLIVQLGFEEHKQIKPDLDFLNLIKQIKEKRQPFEL